MSVVSDYFEKSQLEDIEDLLEDFTKKLESVSEAMSGKNGEEEEIVVSDKEEPKSDIETQESLKKLKDSLEAYSKMTGGKTTTPVYKGQNLMGTPSSMSPYGPMSRVTPPASPLFADLQTTQRGALQNLNTQLTALQKLLRGGVNV
jgi:hypothetical protein